MKRGPRDRVAGSVPAVQRVTAPATVDRDAEARAWLGALRATGAERDEAIRRLHELLLRAARFELRRRRGMLGGASRDTLDDLAMQSADDALVAVLRKLPGFRGESRFTTWAYKFALLEAAVSLRKRAWQGRELPLADEGWEMLVTPSETPATSSETNELFAALRSAIADVLTPHQRDVLVATTLNGVPIDVLAERLNSTRGALYKTLYDARRKLRAHLEKAGFDLSGVSDV